MAICWLVSYGQISVNRTIFFTRKNLKISQIKDFIALTLPVIWAPQYWLCIRKIARKTFLRQWTLIRCCKGSQQSIYILRLRCPCPIRWGWRHQTNDLTWWPPNLMTHVRVSELGHQSLIRVKAWRLFVINHYPKVSEVSENGFDNVVCKFHILHRSQ